MLTYQGKEIVRFKEKQVVKIKVMSMVFTKTAMAGNFL